MLRVFGLLTAAAALVVVGPVGSAQAGTARAGVAQAGNVGFRAATGLPDPNAVKLDTQASGSQAVSAMDKDLVIKVRQAGYWEEAAGKLAEKKGVSPRVRQIGAMIAQQHVQLDAMDVAAAKKLNITLPTQATALQLSWVKEMEDAKGSAFDDIYVDRLRAAHGKIFAQIALVRAGTLNDTMRAVAQAGNTFVLTHISLLESTGLVQYGNLPQPLPPLNGPTANAAARSQRGGIAVSMIWLVLGVALISGMIATARMVRPRAFGGRRSGLLATPEPPPLPRTKMPGGDDDYPYPYPPPRQRLRSNL
jgi:predicted outer membrane protein